MAHRDLLSNDVSYLLLGCCGGVVRYSGGRTIWWLENIGRHTTSNSYIWLLVVACTRRRPHPGNCFDQQAKLCMGYWKRDVSRKGNVYPHQCMKLLWIKLSRAVIRRDGSSGQSSTHLHGLTVESRRQLCDGCSWRRAQYTEPSAKATRCLARCAQPTNGRDQQPQLARNSGHRK